MHMEIGDMKIWSCLMRLRYDNVFVAGDPFVAVYFEMGKIFGLLFENF